MTKDELKKAFALAKSSEEDLSEEDLSGFHGYGLRGYEGTHCTIRQLAGLIRYQCQRFDGTWDREELDLIAKYGRHKFTILDQ